MAVASCQSDLTQYDMALKQRTADSTAKYLMDLGIAKDRIITVNYVKRSPCARRPARSAGPGTEGRSLLS